MYDAGTAGAAYKIDLAQARQAAEEIKQLWASIARSQATSSARGVPNTTPRAQSFAAEQRAIASLAAQEARLLRIRGDTARASALEADAEARLQAALVRTDVDIKEQIVLQKQLLALKTQVARSRPPPITPQEKQAQGLSFNQALGAFGLATIGPQAVGSAINAGIEAGKSAIALRETENSLRAVAGSQKVYNDILSQAQAQQRLFGGTLQENIEGLSGLAVTSRQSGASLEGLIDISKRLATLDPAQGLEGARVALNEALSGDPHSLAARFEIPRASLSKLRDTTSSASDRLKVIDDFLNGVGITSASVAGKVDQSALAFRGLSAELDTLKTRAGSGLADLFAPAATGLSRLIGLVNSNPEAIAQLRALSKGQVTQDDIAQVQREQRAGRINEALSGAARTGQEVIDPLSGALSSSEEGNRLLEILTPLRDRIVEVGSASDASAAGVQDMVQALTAGRIQGEQLPSILNAIADRERGVDDVEDRRVQTLSKLKRATEDETTSLAAQLIKTEEARVKSEELTGAQSALAQIGDAVKAGLITSGQGASILAGALQLPIDKARELLSLQAQIAGQQAAVQREITRPQVSAIGKRDIDSFGLPTQQDVKDAQQFVDQANAATSAQLQKAKDFSAQQGRIKDAQFQKDLAAAKDAQAQIAIVRKRLAETTDPVERLNLETQIIQLQNQADKAADRAGKQRVSAAEKALSLEERIRDSKEAQLKSSLEVQKLTAQDTLDRLKEQQELAKAERILRSGRASERFKTAAAAREQIIGADQQLRQLDIAEKTLTAGGQIINGRVFQSRQGGAVPTGAIPTPTGGAALPTGAPAAATAGNVVTFRLVDTAGRVIAEAIAPFIAADALAQIESARSAGTGRTP